jgi:S-adenosylmethionine hydrolase
MPLITLLTDFGLKDGYVGIMKGVIWSIIPMVQIADLSHEIAPQNVMQGALVLERAAGYFPAGTVHIAVVDPGVGTSRRAIAVRLGSHTFVGPDNGLFSLVMAKAQADQFPVSMVHLDRPEFWLKHVSQVFHGRDIFAPVGAHLANGVPLHSVGSRMDNPVHLSIAQPQPIPDGWVGQVIDIDAFGNLQTNLCAEHLQGLERISIKVNNAIIKGLSQAFGDRPSGDLAALIDSSGYLSIAVVNGNAAKRLLGGVGDTIEVRVRRVP